LHLIEELTILDSALCIYSKGSDFQAAGSVSQATWGVGTATTKAKTRTAIWVKPHDGIEALTCSLFI